MRTNVVIKSADRELFGVKIRQETKNGFLCLSDLQEAYTCGRVYSKWQERGKVQDIIGQKENSERIYYILQEQGLMINSNFSDFIEDVNKHSIVKVLKKLGVYSTKGARENKTTWINPYIWVLVAMELNPQLYAKVSIWLGDTLLLNRIEAGSFYRELSSAITKFKGVDYVTVAKALNYIVWDRHEVGIRNTGTQNELQELRDIEAKLAFAINMGYISTYESLLTQMRKMYNIKWSASMKIKGELC